MSALQNNFGNLFYETTFTIIVLFLIPFKEILIKRNKYVSKSYRNEEKKKKKKTQSWRIISQEESTLSTVMFNNDTLI